MLDHLPERDRPAVKRRLRQAWAETDHERALEQLRLLTADRDLAKLSVAIERDLDRHRQPNVPQTPIQDAATLVTA